MDVVKRVASWLMSVATELVSSKDNKNMEYHEYTTRN